MSVVILFFTYACIRFDVMGEAVFSYRSLPHWGRGTAPAVLGYFLNGALEMIFPALFHPASALSAPTGHLPLEGKAFEVVN